MSSTEPQSVYIDIDHNKYLAEGAGTVDAIVSVSFRARTDEPGPALALRVWTPAGATVVFLKQVGPSAQDLTGGRIDEGPRSGRYPLPASDGRDLDYHLRVEVPPHDVGRERLAARVNVVAGADQVAEGLIVVIWTSDVARAARINPRVAEYTRDVGAATGDQGTARLVGSAADAEATHGTARLQRDAGDSDDAFDARTARVRRES